ncbi:hypothetical protein V6N11_054205 [Hibiscus sabdariffa]|uniref:Uncharacterized protein n=1 Tax=Hibiscus sabdariffa TaxID=183260 RepID=A0ABR2S361_9ROSI
MLWILPMNTQEPVVTETRPAIDVRAADESGVCESPIMPIVHNVVVLLILSVNYMVQPRVKMCLLTLNVMGQGRVH